jgi:hypothetical protein
MCIYIITIDYSSRTLLRTIEVLPRTSGKSLQRVSQALVPQGLPRHLAQRTLRICTCGEAIQTDDLELCLAFESAALTLTSSTTSTSMLSTSTASVTESTSAVSPSSSTAIWTVFKVSSNARRQCNSGAERRWPCLTDDSFVLSCSRPGDGNSDGGSSGSGFSDSAVIFRYEDWAELTVSRGEDGWLALEERVYIAALRCLSHSASANAGLRCRCRARRGHVAPGCIAGSALKHAFGPFATALRGTVLGAAVKYKRVKGTAAADVIRMPAVGDPKMIALLGRAFNRVLDTSAALPGQQSQLIPSQSASASNSEEPIERQWERAAKFVWNNLFGGRMMFAGVEARLDRWSLLLPCAADSEEQLDPTAAIEDKDDGSLVARAAVAAVAAEERRASRVRMQAALESVRREVEAELFRQNWRVRQELLQRAHAADEDDDDDAAVPGGDSGSGKAGLIEEALLRDCVVVPRSSIKAIRTTQQ